MIGQLEVFFRRLRRTLSRSVWLSRLLQLPPAKEESAQPGLLLIQIDGLSESQFERAKERNEVPFLQRLIEREHYHVQTLYSGLPSTTPAVQAELYYGVKGGVPAFGFRDHESGQVFRMFEPTAAAELEERHSIKGEEALLKGGCAYLINYAGGAEETHFCPSSLGWGPALRQASPLVIMVFVLSNIYSFLRMTVLVFVEFGLAIVDFFRGLVDKRDFMKELKFIPSRVVIAILMRELCVIGAKMDLSRGMPVIHLNFLGYDEQSHRRGPDSSFAHWTLRGIDDAVARLWRAANRSAWRHYDVWIFTDHGQAATVAYQNVLGYSVEEAVTAVFAQSSAQPGDRCTASSSIQTQRARFVGGRKIQRLISVLGSQNDNAEIGKPLVVAFGPVGHVYSPIPLTSKQRNSIAHELAHTHKVPLVLHLEKPGIVRGWTDEGEFRLPEDSSTLFGMDHPFQDALGDDVLRLCEHPDAGDFVLLGWRAGIQPITFAMENGAHGGAAPEETNGFVLIPADTRLPEREHAYLRPIDLRRTALEYMGRSVRKTERSRPSTATTQMDTLRITTYNVHSCRGMDGKYSAERIARVIARTNPDVVALQEVDVGRVRSHGKDQAHLIAQYLEMEFHFHASIRIEEEHYGDAILSHLPMRLVKAGPLPRLVDRPNSEERGALWVTITLNGKEIQIINTHLGLNRRERMAQVEALLGGEWLGHEQCTDPVILCGDFNAMPSSRVYARLCERLRDAQNVTRGAQSLGTFPSRYPTLRLDHVFVSPGINVSCVKVPETGLARIASDHLPLMTEIRI